MLVKQSLLDPRLFSSLGSELCHLRRRIQEAMWSLRQQEIVHEGPLFPPRRGERQYTRTTRIRPRTTQTQSQSRILLHPPHLLPRLPQFLPLPPLRTAGYCHLHCTRPRFGVRCQKTGSQVPGTTNLAGGSKLPERTQS